jgi:VIT1/CCC1 family predicted Fe2+/Mn2+ transporter
MPLNDVYQRNVHHRVHKMGWIRAAVLGANDGLIANASLILGVAAAHASHIAIIGVAGIVSGAASMAIGEYISVRSQVDIEESDRQMEIDHLALDPEGERDELAQIYVERGLSPELAKQVADAFHALNPLEAHLRDELGQHDHTKAKPVQAAVASAASFTAGGIIPVLGALVSATNRLWIIAFTLLGLSLTGVISAKTAGSPIGRTTGRVLLLGGLGMAITTVIGSFFHITA